MGKLTTLRRGGGLVGSKMSDAISDWKQKRDVVSGRKKSAESMVLLLDVSGSMGWEVAGVRKIDSLRMAAAAHPSIPKISFSSKIFRGEIPEPNGTTNMAKGFRTIASSYPNREVILVSDGLPNNEEAAIEEALRIGKPVHVIYIGDDTYGKKFMKALAARTGGKWLNISEKIVDTPISQQLETGIAGLLTA